MTLSYGAPRRCVRRHVSLVGRYVEQSLVEVKVQSLTRWRLAQTRYHRRIRQANCVVGDQELIKGQVVKNCQCTRNDFEWCVFLNVARFFH